MKWFSCILLLLSCFAFAGIRLGSLNQCDERLRERGLFPRMTSEVSALCGPVCLANLLVAFFPMPPADQIEEVEALVREIGPEVGLRSVDIRREGVGGVFLHVLARRFYGAWDPGFRVFSKGPKINRMRAQKEGVPLVGFSSSPNIRLADIRPGVILNIHLWNKRADPRSEADWGHYVIVENVGAPDEVGEVSIQVRDPASGKQNGKLTPYRWGKISTFRFSQKGDKADEVVLLVGAIKVSK